MFTLILPFLLPSVRTTTPPHQVFSPLSPFPSFSVSGLPHPLGSNHDLLFMSFMLPLRFMFSCTNGLCFPLSLPSPVVYFLPLPVLIFVSPSVRLLCFSERAPLSPALRFFQASFRCLLTSGLIPILEYPDVAPPLLGFFVDFFFFVLFFFLFLEYKLGFSFTGVNCVCPPSFPRTDLTLPPILLHESFGTGPFFFFFSFLSAFPRQPDFYPPFFWTLCPPPVRPCYTSVSHSTIFEISF